MYLNPSVFLDTVAQVLVGITLVTTSGDFLMLTAVLLSVTGGGCCSVSMEEEEMSCLQSVHWLGIPSEETAMFRFKSGPKGCINLIGAKTADTYLHLHTHTYM